jgi:enoyl-CoA hydratase/carnithine racemase
MLLALSAICGVELASPLLVTTHANSVLELRLNRPSKLNSLTGELVDLLAEQVARAAADDGVSAVLLSAEGKAFCAGGDIKAAAALPVPERCDFLRREYSLMLALHQLQRTKPVLALANGYVFGAGGGLFMAAGTRICSSAASFSMPECVLGIVPDCGATDFLTALPGSLGRWAAFTGARFDASLMASTGLATHSIHEAAGEDIDSLRERLISCDGDADALYEALGQACCPTRGTATAPGLAALEGTTARVFGRGPPSGGGGGGGDATALKLNQISLELEQLDAKLAAEPEAATSWAPAARAQLARASPAALLVTHAASHALTTARDSTADPHLRRAHALGIELTANQALGSLWGGFEEGVACAVGVKRGEAPRWRHGSVAEAAADPEVREILDRVGRALPLRLE